MPAPVFTDADFLAAFQALLPTGPIWPRERDSVLVQTLAALVPAYTRLAARAGNLLVDAFPVAPVELLAEWEETLGLPDPCAGPSPTVELRQQQVATRFLGIGGQSKAYYIEVAARLGYAITITEFTAYRFGETFGVPIPGANWAFAWQVNAPSFAIEAFQFGRDVFGDPFAAWGNNLLQCELQRLAPAHTEVVFSYGAGPSLGGLPPPVVYAALNVTQAPQTLNAAGQAPAVGVLAVTQGAWTAGTAAAPSPYSADFSTDFGTSGTSPTATSPFSGVFSGAFGRG